MEEFIKKHLQENNTIIFSNETTAKEDLYRLELCMDVFKYTIVFCRIVFQSYSFPEFYKKFEEYKEKYSLQLKSW